MMRCPRCGSYAVRARHVDPLPGSATVGHEMEITCREPTCGFQVTNRPEEAMHLFDPPTSERLEKASLAHAGLVVIAANGPPDPRDPFVQQIRREIALYG